jgi:hypothetical protein
LGKAFDIPCPVEPNLDIASDESKEPFVELTGALAAWLRIMRIPLLFPLLVLWETEPFSLATGDGADAEP